MRKRAPENGRIHRIRDQLHAAAEQLRDRPAWRKKLQSLADTFCEKDEEHRLAQELQERLLPARLPKIKGLRIGVRFLPGSDGGSDLHDVFETGEGTVGFFLAEARGTGLPAALLLTLTKVAIDGARTRLLSPGAILEQVNAELVARKTTGQYLAAFLGLLDVRTLSMRYVNASYPCPLLYGRRGVRLLCTEGQFLGRFKRPGYSEKELHVEPGDRLLFYSPGVTKGQGSGGRAYSVSRIRGRLAAEPALGQDAVLHRLVADLKEHRGGSRCPRDVTLISVELGADLATEMTLVIPTDPAQLNTVVMAVMERLKKLHYGERSQFALRLCLEEALINAMKHGNRMDRTKKIVVTCFADARGARIGVEDEGPGFHPEAVPNPTRPEYLHLTHGRGLLLMRSYMDKVQYNAKGNRVTLIKKAPWQ